MSTGMRMLVLVALAVACGSPPTRAPITARWSPPPLLAHIPDESPYVIAAISPAGEMPTQLLRNLEPEIAGVVEAFADLSDDEWRALDPGVRALLVVMNELRGKPVAAWFAALGLSPDLDVVVYALSIWPVARMAIADARKLRDILERVARAADLSASQRRFGDGTYWTVDFKKASALVIAIDERRNQLIAAMLPTTSIPDALPHLLGGALPERSLATTQRVPDLLAKHTLPGLSFGYLDQMLLLAALDRPPTALDRPWRDKIPTVSRACRADIGRIAQAMPRIVAGYRRNDDRTFDMSVIVEVPASVTTALAGMRTSVPPLPEFRVSPMFAFGAAIDGDRLIDWVRDRVRAWGVRGDRCEWFTPLDDSLVALASALENPHVILHGLRGGTLVVDEFETSPPNIAGDLLLVGDRVHELPKLLGTVIPTFAGVAIASDGRPIPIPTARLGVSWTMHLGAKGDRLAVAAGPNSDRRVTERLASTASRAPLLAFESDLAKFYAMRTRTSPDKPQRDRSVDQISIRLELRDGALDFVIAGRWRRPTASAP